MSKRTTPTSEPHKDDPQTKPDPYIGHWRRRRTEQQEQNRRLAIQARHDAAQVAAMLRRSFGVHQVILFGSLVKGRFGPWSDLDLAVMGLEHDQLFPAMARANELSRFWIDLKPLEELEPHFRDRAVATGEVLL